MVRHVIVWTLKDEYSDSEKAEIKAGIKSGLEGLLDKIPGLVEIKVYTEGLESSSGDAMLDSVFESAEALKEYSSNPAHVEVATTKVRPFVKVRSSYDYVVED
ncbi:MAG: Dabb family protein [Clostridiales bacterium]|nr:Dabb family protein [Clostridiales bacterium]